MEKSMETEIIDNIKYELIDIDDEDCPIRINDGGFTFEQYLIKANDKPKYLIALYQDGEIWSDEEIWGTKIIDLETIKEYDVEFMHSCKMIDCCYYVSGKLKDILHSINTELFEENEIYGLKYEHD